MLGVGNVVGATQLLLDTLQHFFRCSPVTGEFAAVDGQVTVTFNKLNFATAQVKSHRFFG